jgi:thioredoxin-like negative regulator of GroEL
MNELEATGLLETSTGLAVLSALFLLAALHSWWSERRARRIRRAKLWAALEGGPFEPAPAATASPSTPEEADDGVEHEDACVEAPDGPPGDLLEPPCPAELPAAHAAPEEPTRALEAEGRREDIATRVTGELGLGEDDTPESVPPSNAPDAPEEEPPLEPAATVEVQVAEPPASRDVEQPVPDVIEPPAAFDAEQPVSVHAEPPATFEVEPPATSEVEPPAVFEVEPPAAFDEQIHHLVVEQLHQLDGLIERGELREARGLLAKLAESSPRDHPLRRRAGRLALRSGRVEVAVRLLERCLEHEPDDLQCRLEACAAHAELGHFEDVVRHARRGLEFPPKDGRLLVHLSEAAYELGASEEALELATEALRRRSKPESFFHVTRLLALTRRLAAGDAERLRLALDQHPGEPALLFAAGVFEAMHGSRDAALRILHSASERETTARHRRAIDREIAALEAATEEDAA